MNGLVQNGLVLGFGLALLMSVSASHAQRLEPAPDALDGVGIEEHRGVALPLDLEFRKSDGRMVRLAEVFQRERPVLLSLTYSDCPMLCHLQLDGLVRALQELEWSPGVEFDVVNVSIDPKESWQRARLTKQKHIKAYGRTETAAGWHFLTGGEREIQTLADTVGFQFKFVPERNEYAHAACIIACTPDGQVSRYLYGVMYPPQTVRLSLVEAGEGKIGSALDQVLLFCFHYDAASGKYAPAAFRIMQIGGVCTLLTLLIGLTPYWLRSNRQSREAAAPIPVLEGQQEDSHTEMESSVVTDGDQERRT